MQQLASRSRYCRGRARRKSAKILNVAFRNVGTSQQPAGQSRHGKRERPTSRRREAIASPLQARRDSFLPVRAYNVLQGAGAPADVVGSPAAGLGARTPRQKLAVRALTEAARHLPPEAGFCFYTPFSTSRKKPLFYGHFGGAARSPASLACCARAASGHAAAPPSAASNSRRPMVTVIRPSLPREVRKRNDTTPPAAQSSRRASRATVRRRLCRGAGRNAWARRQFICRLMAWPFSERPLSLRR